MAIILCFYFWYNDIQEDKKVKTTQGIITKIELDNHGQYDYEYSVGGITYNGGEIIAGVTLYTGQHVTVVYNPDNPQVSSLTRFGDTGTRPIPILFCAGCGLLCYFALRKFLIDQLEANMDPYE
jgi:hypothetical protein